MADPGSAASVPGQTVAKIFTQAISDIASNLPKDKPGLVEAVDVEVTLKSLQVDEKGWSLLWKKEHTDQSTIEIRLATRINISTLDCE